MPENTKAVGLLLSHMTKSNSPKNKARALAPPHAPDDRVAKFTLNYLDAFGYLKNELAQWSDIKIGDIVDAIKSFQGFFGLPSTGEVSTQTVKAMEMPRCGCPDIDRAHNTRFAAARDFAAASLPRWRKTGITYTIKDYLPGIAKPAFEQAVFAAFANWTALSSISVNPALAGQTPDIIISNGQGAQSNFDGPGGTLAWAYLPDGNDQQLLMEFDLGETWVLDAQSRGIILANVACHEFGHLLGLSHSTVQSALMAPYYNPAIAVPQANDDIPRFQARYGVKPPTGNPPPVNPPPVNPTGHTVTIQSVGTVTVTVDGKNVTV